jgi:two-component system OmpR family response regulator
MKTVLVVDDEPKIATLARDYLEHAGFAVLTASDGPTALTTIRQRHPDLVVLDLGLPGLDGLDVTRELRRDSAIPIVMLTARDDELDKLLGLELGADDYLTKPFSPRELVARVNVILRRARAAPVEAAPAAALSHGRLTLDPATRAATFAGLTLGLTAIEFAIVRCLLARPAHVLNRAQLVAASHAASIHISERTIDSHIRNIRAKLLEAGAADAIETVHGVGFRLGRCGG